MDHVLATEKSPAGHRLSIAALESLALTRYGGCGGVRCAIWLIGQCQMIGRNQPLLYRYIYIPLFCQSKIDPIQYSLCPIFAQKPYKEAPRVPPSVVETSQKAIPSTVNKNELNKLWSNLEGEKDFNDDHREEITDFVQSIPGFQECDEEDIESPEWHAIQKTGDFKC
ncbi:hypothetical protein TNCV_4443961 [Trichonephila clavipes]|nr:hypothetical protein TNCV_4443961 [Trichonephila clavipes]